MSKIDFAEYDFRCSGCVTRLLELGKALASHGRMRRSGTAPKDMNTRFPSRCA